MRRQTRMPDGENTFTDTQKEAQLKVLRAIHDNPSLSQRELSKQLGISLGKANYCVQALLEQGWIKARNFKNCNNKIAYTYLLTPKGVEQKLALTFSFLSAKQREFEELSREIQQLSQEASDQ
ncbi:MarR family EPS-associated transcriptional regulator [Granulosicoccus sp.]|nr:MarR family EPS-associated transcriptional regulator [Granulosicoccus sp.]